MSHIRGHIEDIFSANKSLSGQAVFLLANTRLSLLGLPPILDAPNVPAFDVLSLVAFVADASAGSINLSFTPTVPAGYQLIVRASAPISQGISYFSRSIFSYLATFDEGITSPQSIAAEYIAKHGAITAREGQKIVLECYFVQKISGLSGLRQRINSIIVP